MEAPKCAQTDKVRTNMGQTGRVGLCLVRDRALVGLQTPLATVEVHMVNGLPSFTLMGLADVDIKQARERVHSVILNSGLEFPHNQRITVNRAHTRICRTSEAKARPNGHWKSLR